MLVANLILCFVGIATIKRVHSAPGRSKGTFTTFDQKQTGDYNIQLHLKDFQIVALVNDDTLSAFGDYDYDYDYSDLTIKPHNSSSTTAKPQEPLNSSTTKPSSSSIQHPISSEQPALISEATTPSSSSSITTQNIVLSTAITSISTEKQNISTESPAATIKVFISTEKQQDYRKLGEPQQQQLNISEVSKQHQMSVTVIPFSSEGTAQEIVNNGGVAALSEISHYNRRCQNGYTRDKRGRCKKTRRPGVIPYGISRFASNLAAQLRQVTSAEKDDSSSESAED